MPRNTEHINTLRHPRAGVDGEGSCSEQRYLMKVKFPLFFVKDSAGIFAMIMACKCGPPPPTPGRVRGKNGNALLHPVTRRLAVGAGQVFADLLAQQGLRRAEEGTEATLPLEAGMIHDLDGREELRLQVENPM